MTLFLEIVIMSLFENHLRHQDCKNEDTEMKYFKNIQKKPRILKVTNSLLELDMYFEKLKDRELKTRRKIAELFLNQLLHLWIYLKKNKMKQRPLAKTLGEIG